jgi:biotin carboxylase
MKKIAIIGGSYLQLPVVLMARRLGYETHCFAWEAGAVCKQIADHFYPISVIEKSQILAVCREIGIDGVLTIASDVAVPTVNYVADRMRLVGNPDESSILTTNKYHMRECFARHGLPSPRFVRAKSGESTAWDGFDCPVIVKPTDRSGSLGVQRVAECAEIGRAVERACSVSFSHEAVVEEFVPGREVSVESISWEGQHNVLMITDKVTTGAPFFVELEHHQPSSLPPATWNQLLEMVPKALTSLNVRYGASHSELKISDDGEIRLIEIGARLGGDFIGSDLVRLSTGYDFLKGVVETAMGSFVRPILSGGRFAGVYFLCKETEHLLPILEHPDRYREVVRAEITDPELKHVECSADRSGYFIYQSNERFSVPGGAGRVPNEQRDDTGRGRDAGALDSKSQRDGAQSGCGGFCGPLSRHSPGGSALSPRLHGLVGSAAHCARGAH